MTTSRAPESVLTIDFGSTQTRALLFDIVEGRYYFIAAGNSPTTAAAPFFDVSESAHLAVLHLQEITGRRLVDQDGLLIIPTQPDGMGVDRLAMTISAGKQMRIVATGLLPDVSLESVRRLASTTYGEIVETIHLNDRRRQEEQVDAILHARPDLILMAGGADNGASRSVLKIADLVAMAYRLMPDGNRPVVVFTGNQSLSLKIKENLQRWANVYITPNVRPAVDVEDLNPAQEALAEIFGRIRINQVSGLEQLAKISSAPILPTAYAFGRMIRFLSSLDDPKKQTLGVDIGAESTVIAAAQKGQMALNVFELGVGRGIQNMLDSANLKGLMQWLALDLNAESVLDYLNQKCLYPASLPATPEALAIEQALARRLLEQSMRRTRENWPELGYSFEPIVGSGAVLAQAPRPDQSLRIILDGLQPVGITTILLDRGGILPALGSAAHISSVLPAQLLDSGALVNLGTVICPLSNARAGTPVLRAHLDYEDGKKARVDALQGTLTSLPLRYGQSACIRLEPLRNIEIDPRQKRGTSGFTIVGGECGAVIDTRNRPIQLPADTGKRLALLNEWQKALEKA